MKKVNWELNRAKVEKYPSLMEYVALFMKHKSLTHPWLLKNSPSSLRQPGWSDEMKTTGYMSSIMMLMETGGVEWNAAKNAYVWIGGNK